MHFPRNSYEAYKSYVKTYVDTYGLGLDSINTLVQAGNWVYPSIDNDFDFETRIRDKGFDVGEMEVKASTWMNGDIELKVQKKHFETKFPKKYIKIKNNVRYIFKFYVCHFKIYFPTDI